MFIIWALVPPLLFILLFFLLDPNRKPVKAIGWVALWSHVVFIPYLILVCVKIVLNNESNPSADNVALQIIESAFLGAAIPEETCKWVALWLFVKKSRNYFQSPYDGILWGASIGAIFAGLENVFFFFGGYNIIARSLFSLPGHIMHTLIMGYFFFLICKGMSSLKYKVCMFLVPILFHGLWDMLVFLIQREHNSNIIGLFVLLLMAAVFVAEIICCVKLTKASRRRSKVG